MTECSWSVVGFWRGIESQRSSRKLSNIRKLLCALGLLMVLASPGQGVAEPSAEQRAVAESIVKSLDFQSGAIELKKGGATLNLNDGYRYLSPNDSHKVLEDLWGNPRDRDILGMIFPANAGPLDSNVWAVVLSYSPDGYVSDESAETINYDELLKGMQADVVAANPEREKAGYEPLRLVGWAEPPRYHKDEHKLYWAKELEFGGSPEHVLNYNIRALGRHGVLVLNVIGSMESLPDIKAATPELLSMVNFAEGSRYQDFNASSDKVAAYGIAALIAGGVASKAGFFKVLLAGLLAAKKFIVIAFLAVAAFIRKLFNRKASGKSPE